MTATTRADTPDRPWLRAILALLFITSGVLHLILPGPYRGIMPSYLPAPALLWPATRRAAGWGLLLLLLAVFPANVEMLRLYKARGVSGLGESLLWLRLPLQALLMWGVWRVSRRRTG
jgi:uncharacterized membrane protein